MSNSREPTMPTMPLSQSHEDFERFWSSVLLRSQESGRGFDKISVCFLTPDTRARGRWRERCRCPPQAPGPRSHSPRAGCNWVRWLHVKTFSSTRGVQSFRKQKVLWMLLSFSTSEKNKKQLKTLHESQIPYEGAGRVLAEAALIIPAFCWWNKIKKTGHEQGWHFRLKIRFI